MDLLRALEVARQARDLVRDAAAPDWASDEEAFFRHFGVPHEAYEAIVAHLGPDQERMLGATLAVNPEAAVLWVLSMEELGETI